MTRPRRPAIRIRNVRPDDFQSIHELSRIVYPNDEPWLPEQLASHLEVFPEGQIVATIKSTGEVVGYCASLIVTWEDYSIYDNYQKFTGDCYFRNHDPAGKTLYAAEVMVDPRRRGLGIGKKLYRARRDLVRRLGLRRIRAGARLRGYSAYAAQIPAEEYVKRVIRGDIIDPTLTFQINNGFRVLAVVNDYLYEDPDSMGYAAVIEWINHRVASKEDYAGRDRRFAKPRKPRQQPASERGNASSRHSSSS